MLSIGNKIKLLILQILVEPVMIAIILLGILNWNVQCRLR